MKKKLSCYITALALTALLSCSEDATSSKAAPLPSIDATALSQGNRPAVIFEDD